MHSEILSTVGRLPNVFDCLITWPQRSFIFVTIVVYLRLATFIPILPVFFLYIIVYSPSLICLKWIKYYQIYPKIYSSYNN